jgi:[ribosomal protein S18]-alanine N-acetyltransferase
LRTTHPHGNNKAFVFSLELRPLTADLLPAVVDLDHQCFGGLWTLDGYRRELDSPNSEILVMQPGAASLGRESGLLGLGCYWAILEEAHITIMAIAPEYQGQGLGQALLWALLASAHHRGLERATLEVRASNQAALALYQKYGFTEAGRRRRYYPDTQEDALILWRGKLQYPDFAQALARWQADVRDRLQQGGWNLKLSN